MYVNWGIGLGLRRPVTAEDLDQVEAFYDDVGAPAELELCPLAIDIEAVLEVTTARGWSLTSLRPTFLLDLSARARTAPPVAPVPAFRTVDDGSLAVWQAILATGFSQTEGGAREVSDRFSAGAHGAPGALDLVIEVDGRPAGACSVTIGPGGVAWLGGMTVLPEHRDRGLQQVALDHRVTLARDAGCDVAAVGALHGGPSSRNVQRAGFAMAWTNAVVRRPASRGAASDAGAPATRPSIRRPPADCEQPPSSGLR